MTVFTYLCGDQNVNVYCACGDQRPFWGQNPNPHEFEDVSESQCGFSVRVRIRRSFWWLGKALCQLDVPTKTWKHNFVCVCVFTNEILLIENSLIKLSKIIYLLLHLSHWSTKLWLSLTYSLKAWKLKRYQAHPLVSDAISSSSPGSGTSKKLAKRNAAAKMLSRIHDVPVDMRTSNDPDAEDDTFTMVGIKRCYTDWQMFIKHH